MKYQDIILSFLVMGKLGQALIPSQAWQRHPPLAKRFTWNSSLSLASNDNTLDELSEERKASLFQYLLRDLQVEGVPLLEVDADELEVLQVAMWTTISQLVPMGDKACVILEEIPVDKLRKFIDDFMSIKSEQRILSAVPDLEKVNLSLVGKGIGPAILIDVVDEAKRDDDSTINKDTEMEPAITASFKQFLNRMISRTDVYPYKKTDASTAFKVCHQKDVPTILSAFWNAICELRVSNEEALGTTYLLFPGIEDHELFTAVSEIISRSLCLFGNDQEFKLVHYFPEYDREKVYPSGAYALGHIPPLEWLQKMNGGAGAGDASASVKLADVDISLSNYQRRSPVAAVGIKRASLVQTENAVFKDVTMENGQVVVPSEEVVAYTENAKFLAAQGEAKLEEAMAHEKSTISK